MLAGEVGRSARGKVGQSEGQAEGFIFIRKCNDPNGLSRDLTLIQILESYRWTISHPSLKTKMNRAWLPRIGATATLFI